MANPYHSLRQAEREAFARAPSRHDELFGMPDARIGSTLRIRLPNDWTVRDTLQLCSIAPAPAREEPTLAQSGSYLLDAITGEIQPLAVPTATPAHLPAPWLERERAEKRSMELLYDWLSDAQRKELALEGYFTITGESSGKRYQVHKMHSFGLKELDDDGNVVASFCIVPAGTHALGDTMLAQKIWMETDEETTLARANRMGAHGPFWLERMYPNA